MFTANVVNSIANILNNLTPEERFIYQVTGVFPENPNAVPPAEYHPEPFEPGSCYPNIMSHTVHWFRNEENPLLLKIGVVALGLIVLIGIGYLIGFPILFPIAVIIPCVMWSAVESARVTDELSYITRTAFQRRQVIEQAEQARIRHEREAQESAQERAEAYHIIIETFGGNDIFQSYPELDIGDRVGDTGFIDFLRTEDLSHPIMRGVDAFGRPFISLKLRETGRELGSEDFVLTFFQRYPSRGVWTLGSNHDFRDEFDTVLGRAGLEDIRRIVVTRDHPSYNLIP